MQAGDLQAQGSLLSVNLKTSEEIRGNFCNIQVRVLCKYIPEFPSGGGNDHQRFFFNFHLGRVDKLY